MPAPEEALSAKNITFTGYEGAEINAYRALPTGAGPFPGVLVIHHLPGWDSTTKEITRRFAAEGYNALRPNLYARQGLDVDPTTPRRPPGGRRHPRRPVRGRRRGRGGALRALPTSNGKVGVIGYCSGGRHSFLTAVSVPVDAAVDCYGAFRGDLPDGFPLKVTPLVDRTPTSVARCSASSATTTSSPTPNRSTNSRPRCKAAGKTYEFFRYDGAGHAFSRWTGRRTGPRPRWTAGSGSSSGTAATWRGADHVLLPHRRHRDRRQRQGRAGLDAVTSASVYFDHPFHAPFDHTLNIDFADPKRGPGARVAVELSAESARRLVESINEALAAAGAAAL